MAFKPLRERPLQRNRELLLPRPALVCRDVILHVICRPAAAVLQRPEMFESSHVMHLKKSEIGREAHFRYELPKHRSVCAVGY
jgi:hypothetical protein